MSQYVPRVWWRIMFFGHCLKKSRRRMRRVFTVPHVQQVTNPLHPILHNDQSAISVHNIGFKRNYSACSIYQSAVCVLAGRGVISLLSALAAWSTCTNGRAHRTLVVQHHAFDAPKLPSKFSAEKKTCGGVCKTHLPVLVQYREKWDAILPLSQQASLRRKTHTPLKMGGKFPYDNRLQYGS